MMAATIPYVFLALVLASAGAQFPKFPDRFTADIHTNGLAWPGISVGCGGVPMARKVYQDFKSNSTLWSHLVISNGQGFEEVLITVPASTADPTTPEATRLTKFTWTSNTSFENCVYQLVTENPDKIPVFFGYPTPVLEKRETIGQIECEKWSNNGSWPHHPYWAMWYPVNAQPPHSVVLQAQYISPHSLPHQFPTPGCSQIYTFSNFNTDPISPEQFKPPKQWFQNCRNSDGGIRKFGIPGRQEGYVCVSPGKKNSFSIALQTKPVHNVTIQIKPCISNDHCIDGARCKDCVKFSSTKLTFGPNNWSELQTVEVTYQADGDSQFVFGSSDYYINDTFNTQFSTCACASGKSCSNNCQMSCGHV